MAPLSHTHWSWYITYFTYTLIVTEPRTRRRERKQKWGSRSGLPAKFRKQPHKPPLPSIYLTNARSMVLKTAELELQLPGNRYIRDGGGLCIFVHNTWSNNSTIINSHCSPDLEIMSVKCRPFFLPRKLTVVIITAVYRPPDSIVSIALALLLNAINK